MGWEELGDHIQENVQDDAGDHRPEELPGVRPVVPCGRCTSRFRFGPSTHGTEEWSPGGIFDCLELRQARGGGLPSRTGPEGTIIQGRGLERDRWFGRGGTTSRPGETAGWGNAATSGTARSSTRRFCAWSEAFAASASSISGAGTGTLTRRWAREGASRSVGVDRSAASLRFARRREMRRPSGAEFVRRDSADLTGFGSGSFDLVAAHMSLMDIADAAATIREVRRVLAAGGRFIFSISHPCFDIDLESTWVVERAPFARENSVFRKVRGYRKERVIRVPWNVSKTEVAYTLSYHRTLATYLRYLRAAGLAVVRMEEPLPGPEAIRNSPQGAFMREIPLHLVVEAVPWSRPTARPEVQATGVANVGTYSRGGRPTIGIACPQARQRFFASRFQAWIVNP